MDKAPGALTKGFKGLGDDSVLYIWIEEQVLIWFRESSSQYGVFFAPILFYPRCGPIDARVRIGMTREIVPL